MEWLGNYIQNEFIDIITYPIVFLQEKEDPSKLIPPSL